MQVLQEHEVASKEAGIVRCSLGSEPSQWVACEVLKHSIRRRTERPVEFVESWSKSQGWHPLMAAAPKLKGGTGFNVWRWLTPQLFGHGKAIYLDADQVVLADIGELWDQLQAAKTIAVVTEAVGIFGPKKTPEPGKLQTSVMLMDCAKLRQAMHPCPIGACVAGTMAYRDLMQATWLPRKEVQTLAPGWNHFGIVNEQTKLIHYSHVSSQPYRRPDHPAAWVFGVELRQAVADGVISVKQLKEEADAGHIHAHWWRAQVATGG